MKKFKFVLVLLAIILCTGCIKFSFNINGNVEDEPSTIIEYDPVDGTPVPVKPEPVEPGKKIKFNDSITATSMECDYSAKLLFEYDNKKIYSYCVKNIKINDKELDEESISELIDVLNTKDRYNDSLVLTYKEGGTKLYTGSEMKILRCNHLVDFSLTNQDIYIGDVNLTYKGNFCKPSNKTVTKRFKVTEIKDKYVTLSRDNETATIYYDEVKELEVGKTYDFELLIGEDLIYQDTIEQLFNLGTIIEIREVK